MSPARLWIVALVLMSFSAWVGLQIGPGRDGQYIFLFAIPAIILLALSVLLWKRKDDLQSLRDEVNQLRTRIEAIDKRLDSLVKPDIPQAIEDAK